MKARHSYRLLDFGDGEKLEDFGGVWVRRPCLYARERKQDSKLWRRANFRFDATQKRWSGSQELSEPWKVRFEDTQFLLKKTPVGHLGVFPEQQENWQWVGEHFSPDVDSNRPALKALNLFAYTGGSTMALARCGMEVAHVDGAANTVKWARANAESSGLADASIRWITEDAMRFVTREIKRGRSYDVLVADPPSFGRGPKKEQWRIARDLPELLDSIQPLMPNPKAIIISSHTEGFDHRRLKRMISQAFDTKNGSLKSFKLTLTDQSERQLESGDCVRWIAH